MRNGVQLITYADRLAPGLAALRQLLASDPWSRAFTGVHILPFFTPYDGADAGFDPVDHTRVDPRLGTWDDVAGIAREFDLMVDVIVNHVSAESSAFQDVLRKGEGSEQADMFLTLSSVFPDGATEEQLAGIYRPRPGLPFTPYTAGGHRRLFWTTFTPQQIDIDVHSRSGDAYLTSILDTLAGVGARSIRLDAVGYAIKTPGTSCFMTPETFDFIDQFAARARERGLEVLVEIHAHHRKQVEIARALDRVYDFALPPLLLHALYTGQAGALARWMGIRPTNAITVLDTHDGIGVIDVGPEGDEPGLLTAEQIDDLVEGIHEHSEGASRRATGAAASNLDLYQVNSTYYDALGRDDAAYLLARAIQVFTPGIPQVYYTGALAGSNDEDLLGRTGVGRDINRHHYSAGEVAQELRRPVVRALFALFELRSTHPAFQGAFSFDEGDAHTLVMRWDSEEGLAELSADLARPGASRLVIDRGGETLMQGTVEEILRAAVS